MSKRFIDTNIFRKPLLRGMDAPYKLLYIYMFCECNHAGIWEVELDVAGIRIGHEYNEVEALEEFGEEIHQIDDSKWFVTGFPEFQYGTLNPENRAHKSVMDILEKYELKGLIRPLQGCKDMDMDKDKVLDKDKSSKRKPPLSETQKKRTKIGINSSQMVDIGNWFGRKASTLWTIYEAEALEQLGELTDEELDLMEKYYMSSHKYLRQDISTLLNNWTGELDRARKWSDDQKPPDTGKKGIHGI